jgi:hypothetical protein
MAMDVGQKARRCCAIEKNRLNTQLDLCDNPQKGHSARRRCYRDAARRSGRRARACIAGG